MLAIATLGFYACKQENLKPEGLQMSENPQSNSASIPCSPANPDNPFDSVGIIHNLALNDVKNSVGFSNSTINQRVNRANQYLSQQFGISATFTISTITNIIADSSNSFNTTINNLSVSNNLRNRLRNVVFLIKNNSDFDNYCDLKNQIMILEQAVIDDNTLSTNEKNIFLKVSSIARHTLHYWTSIYWNEIGYDVNDPLASATERSKRPWWKWVVVGLCDVAGGIAGGGAGIAGVVAGAAGASSGASSLVDWISPDN
jgi:hypothetical protein